MIKASAPARAGIIGNPTDGYGGSMISSSLGVRAEVTISECDRLELSFGDQETVIAKESDLRLDSGFFDIAKSVIRYLKLGNRKFRMEGVSDVPYRSGLSGSTAMLSATFGAVMRYLEKDINPYIAAETIRHIELNYMDIQCGYQDQYMTVFGGLNYLDFRTKEIYRDLEDEIFATVEPLHAHVDKLPFILVHTGVQRISGSVLKPIRERWLDNDHQVVDGYNKIAEYARLGKKALLAGDWTKVGQLMNKNHLIQQQLGASGEVNDQFISLALRVGALGAKLAGAGGGGTIIALHFEPEKVVEAFKEKGNPRVLYLDPGPGLQVEGSL